MSATTTDYQTGNGTGQDASAPNAPNSSDDVGNSPQPALIQPRGALAGIIADVIVRESGHDRVRVTEHPVENGAAITDHSFVEPFDLEVDLGYSDAGNGPGYSAATYQALLSFMQARTPFNFTTGKRLYQSMLITSMAQVTEEKTENALNLSVMMRQVILVSTQATTLPPAANQAMPQSTAAPVNAGDQQTQAPAQPAPTLLNNLIGSPGYTQATGSTPQP